MDQKTNRVRYDIMLSVLVPVYNEAENIISLIEQIKNNINNIGEILIIYDFDEDNTLPVIKNNLNAFENLNIIMIKNDFGPGVVNALKKGFSCAREEYVLVLMADLSDDLGVVNEMIEKMDEGYDVVCGSRYMKGGKQIGGGIFKKTLSKIAGRSLHILSKIPTHDVTNNFKIYRRSILKNIDIKSSGGFEIAMEITVKLFMLGYSITEIPSVWNDREKGKSNFKIWKWMPHYLKWYFYCIFKGSNH